MEEKENHKNKNRINCRRCVNYYVTWDRDHPHGCRAMGFKGKLMPSMAVFNSSGKPCMLFLKKPLRKKD